MKKKFMKKAIAATLSAAVVLSMMPLSGFMDVSAKAPYVKLNTTFKTLKIGQTYKLKLKNNSLGWKVVKAVSKDSMICKAVNKKSYVKLSAKGEGRTTVRVTLKTAKRKGAGAVKKLSCRVNVKPVEVMPDTPEVPDMPEIETSKTVADQAELDQALANKNLTSITLNTAAAGTFTIPEGDHTNVDITVNAPNADVENNAAFKSVTIQAIKENTWKEKAKGNLIRILARKARVVVDTDASVKNIVYAGEYTDASINLEANGAVENVDLQKSVKAEITVAETADVSNIVCAASDSDVQLNAKGTVRNVTLQAKVSLNITGSPKTAVIVTAAEAAKDASVRTSAKVEISVKADIQIQLEKGAEGSKIGVEVKSAIANIANQTGSAVELTRPDGTVYRITARATVKVVNGQASVQGTSNNVSGTAGGGSWYGGSSSTDSSSPSVDELLKKLDREIANLKATFSGTIVVTGGPYSVEQGGYVLAHEENGELWTTSTVTKGALKLTISPIKIPDGLTVEKDEEHFDVESEIVWDMYIEGDRLVGHKIIPWEVKVTSPVKQEKRIYFDITLKKEKWISKDGVLTDSDFVVEQIDQARADELMKPKE